MNEKEKCGQVEKAKEVLSKMDPELAVIAIQHAEVNFEEVSKIKDFLANCDPKAVKYAIAEVQHEEMSKEFEAVKKDLDAFSVDVLQQAAVDLGFISRLGKCFNGIKCGGGCLRLMILRCQASMFTLTDPHEQLVNPVMVEGVVNRAVARALQVK